VLAFNRDVLGLDIGFDVTLIADGQAGGVLNRTFNLALYQQVLFGAQFAFEA
jgi:hypothetical protein